MNQKFNEPKLTTEILDSKNRGALNPSNEVSSSGSISSREHEIIKSRIIVAQSLGRRPEVLKNRFEEHFNNELVIDSYCTTNSTYKLERFHKKTGEKVEIRGLSISSVKDLASIYGHLQYGVDVLSYNHKISAKVRTYCIDLYSNISEDRTFIVLFPAYVGRAKNFSEESYKFIYSEASRRMRSCIERILPLWIIDQSFKRIFQAKVNYYEQQKNKDLIELKGTEKKEVKTVLNFLNSFKKIDKRFNYKHLCDLINFPHDAKQKDFTSENFATLESILTAIKFERLTIEDYLEEFKTEVSEKRDVLGKKDLETLEDH